MSIPTATLTVTIDTFRPISSPYPVLATLALTQGDPQIFTYNDQTETLTITLPTSQTVQLIYQLPDPRYVLLGISFSPVKGGGVGRIEFPSVALNRNPTCSQLFVTDTCLEQYNGISFDYDLLVQEVASGDIGLIDPDIETDIEN
jgi:hypothetical protein